ncbi:MAG: hypothetical protein ACI8PT_003390 [Gammaproteobacteria bacterium]|jgi:hypothetical protein
MPCADASTRLGTNEGISFASEDIAALNFVQEN